MTIAIWDEVIMLKRRPAIPEIKDEGLEKQNESLSQ
jgi:hypothetical protein